MSSIPIFDVFLNQISREGQAVAATVLELKDNVHSAIVSAGRIQLKIQEILARGDMGLENAFEELGALLQAALSELLLRSPPSETAASHEERLNMTRYVLTTVFTTLIGFVKKHGMSDEDAEQLSRDLDKLQPYVELIVVTMGDLIERHNALIKIILFGVLGLVPANAWLLQILFSLLGLGPKGPIQGIFATRALIRLWGEAARRSDWFNVRAGRKILQKAVHIKARL